MGHPRESLPVIETLSDPKKTTPGMRDHNDTAPELIEEEHRFAVRLWR